MNIRHGNNEPARDSVVLDVESAVAQRYSNASQRMEPSLCCPVNYEARYLDILPAELIERDYGCGDPSRYVKTGEYVIDLGSGGGKVCYIAAQIVGPQGFVVGVDMNDDMLALARRFQPEITQRLGYENVRFHKGRIQDLALDLEQLDQYLASRTVRSTTDWLELEKHVDQLRRETPMIASNVADVVISNCVLNLVSPRARQSLFAEIYRVLRPGGRAVISDIVSDEPVPQHLQNDPTLWSGCISGAFLESEFLQAFVQAGFHGVEIVSRPAAPWATVEGIEFRSVTIRAFKETTGPRHDYHEAVMYKGPWQSVTDDRGRLYQRGVATAVSRAAFEILTRAPYVDHLVAIPPRQTVHPNQARPFDESQPRLRAPRETKGAEFQITDLTESKNCCGGGTC